MQLRNYLTIEQAAEVIGCTPGRVRQMANTGGIPGAEKIGNRLWMIPRREVEKIRDARPGTGRPRRRA